MRPLWQALSELSAWLGTDPGAGTASEVFDLLAAFTMARDYAIIAVELDGQPLGDALDLYNYPDVITTGELAFGQRPLNAGPHKLSLTITAANPAALKNYMVGLDYLRLKPSAN